MGVSVSGKLQMLELLLAFAVPCGHKVLLGHINPQGPVLLDARLTEVAKSVIVMLGCSGYVP